jgi:RNA polymerase sigma-70 factor (ECF subfamily)
MRAESQFATAALDGMTRQPLWNRSRRMDQGNPTETKLAQARLVLAVALHQDRSSFDQLFQYYAPRVKAYFLRLGADGGLAEELMQDVMLIVWRRAQLFDPSKAAVSTWIFTIARNRRIDSLRRERRPEIDPTDPFLVPEPRGADTSLNQAQVERRLRSAIAELPAEQAELVRRSYFNDQSHGSIADELRLPLGTVKSRLRLALAKLREKLTEFR